MLLVVAFQPASHMSFIIEDSSLAPLEKKNEEEWKVCEMRALAIYSKYDNSSRNGHKMAMAQ